jgi:hypothetical protein
VHVPSTWSLVRRSGDQCIVSFKIMGLVRQTPLGPWDTLQPASRSPRLNQPHLWTPNKSPAGAHISGVGTCRTCAERANFDLEACMLWSGAKETQDAQQSRCTVPQAVKRSLPSLVTSVILYEACPPRQTSRAARRATPDAIQDPGSCGRRRARGSVPQHSGRPPLRRETKRKAETAAHVTAIVYHDVVHAMPHPSSCIHTKAWPSPEA